MERVIPAVEFRPLPEAPEIVMGVINLQGDGVVVIDARSVITTSAGYLKGVGNLDGDLILIYDLKDPLVHLLRNSIDHGIESPVERKRLGGTLSMESMPGEGSVIVLTCPLSKSSLLGILVRCGDFQCIFPGQEVERTIRVSADQVKRVGNRRTITIDE